MTWFSYETIITNSTEANWNLKFNKNFHEVEKPNKPSLTTILQQTNKNKKETKQEYPNM